MSTKITFDFNSSQITVEGAEAELLNIIKEVKGLAPSLSKIQIINKQPKSSQEINETGSPDQFARHPSSGKPVGVREFAKPLPLANAYQKLTALAYHAIKIQNMSYFSVREMNDWFGLCGFKKPSQMAVALSDARRKYGYVDSKGRDQWTITTSGENLIIDLLERQKVG